MSRGRSPCVTRQVTLAISSRLRGVSPKWNGDMIGATVGKDVRLLGEIKTENKDFENLSNH